MKNENGTPATMTLEQERVDRLARLSPKRTVPTAALLRAYAEIDALRDAVHALTAKAAALDALVGIAGEAATLLGGLIDSEAFDYCTADGGERVGSELSPTEARIMANRDTLAALYSALSAAKAAQVSK